MDLYTRQSVITVPNIQSAAPLSIRLRSPDICKASKSIDVVTSPRDEVHALPAFLHEKIQPSRENDFRFVGRGASGFKGIDEEFGPKPVCLSNFRIWRRYMW